MFFATLFRLEEQTLPRGLIMVGRAAFRDSGGGLFFDGRRSAVGSLLLRSRYAPEVTPKWNLGGASSNVDFDLDIVCCKQLRL